jgi:hypothetical protein
MGKLYIQSLRIWIPVVLMGLQGFTVGRAMMVWGKVQTAL